LLLLLLLDDLISSQTLPLAVLLRALRVPPLFAVSLVGRLVLAFLLGSLEVFPVELLDAIVDAILWLPWLERDVLRRSWLSGSGLRFLSARIAREQSDEHSRQDKQSHVDHDWSPSAQRSPWAAPPSIADPAMLGARENHRFGSDHFGRNGQRHKSQHTPTVLLTRFSARG